MNRLLKKTTFIALVFSFYHTAHADIKVGVILPLTGALAEYGVASKNAIDLLIEESEAKGLPGTKSVTYLFEDNKYLGKETIVAFNKLTSINKVDLVYVWGEDPLNALAPISENKKFPIIAMAADARPARGKKYIVRTINSPEDYMEPILKILKEKNIKNIEIVQVEDSFFYALVDALQFLGAKDDLKITLHHFNPEDMDFRSTIVKIQSDKPQVLGNFLTSGQASLFARQFSALNLKIPVFTTDIAESTTEITEARGGLEGAFFTSPRVPEEFKEKYKKRFGNDLQIAYAYNSYVTADILRRLALKKFSSSEDILPEFEKASKEVAEVKFRESERGGKYLEFSMALKEIKNGVPFER